MAYDPDCVMVNSSFDNVTGPSFFTVEKPVIFDPLERLELNAVILKNPRCAT